MEFVPDADIRYIADQKGPIKVHDADGVRDEPLIEFQDSVFVGNEAGVLGIALHPNFAENRRLFVRYSAPKRSGTPEDYSHTFVLSEFEVEPNGLSVDRDSERTILEIPQPDERHNSGQSSSAQTTTSTSASVTEPAVAIRGSALPPTGTMRSKGATVRT